MNVFAGFEVVPNLGEERLLLEDAKNSHWSFEHVDAILQIKNHHCTSQILDIVKTGCAQTCRSIPKSTMAHSMPSLMYSSWWTMTISNMITITPRFSTNIIIPITTMLPTCSKTNMWWLKNCCSFSLQKLIASCSNPLKSKISKPAMSRTPT